MTAALTVAGLAKSFGEHPVLSGVDLTVAQGECVAVLGSSGCGKSTLLRIVAGLEQADAGTVTVAGEVTDDPRPRVPPERRGVGLVFQDQALWPHMTVRGNIEFVLDARSVARSERKGQVDAALADAGLDADLLERRPGELSGGERQRAAVARALVQEPRLLLLDEPLTGLDRDRRYHLIATLRRLRADRGLATLLVTHDQEEAFALSDRVAVLNGGRIEQAGTPEEVYRRPSTRFVAEFVGVGTCLPATAEGDTLRTAVGSFARNGEPAGPLVAIVRPEDVQASADGDVRGSVLDAWYQGGHWLHDVGIGDDGARVLVRAERRIEVGDAVGLRAARPAFVPAAERNSR